MRSATSASTRPARAWRASRSPASAVLDPRGHGVQRPSQLPDLVTPGHLGPRLEIARGQPAGGVGERLDAAEDDPVAPDPGRRERQGHHQPEPREIASETPVGLREGPRPRKAHAEVRAPAPGRPGERREPEQPHDPVGSVDLGRAIPLLRERGRDHRRFGQGLTDPARRVGVASQDRAALVRERHRPARRQVSRGVASDPREVQRGEDDGSRAAPRIGHGKGGDQLGAPARGVDLVIARGEGLGAHGPIEPRAVRDVHRPGQRHGAAGDLPVRPGHAQGHEIGELPENRREAGPARSGVHLRRGGQGHEQAPRLAEPLLVRPGEPAGEAKGRLAPLLDGLPALGQVGVRGQAKGGQGGHQDQGHQAVAEARDPDRRHGRSGSVLPVPRVPGTI